ncbi:MAG: hypothetical protein R2749_01565 [Acidimicrobiales bacterium]
MALEHGGAHLGVFLPLAVDAAVHVGRRRGGMADVDQLDRGLCGHQRHQHVAHLPTQPGAQHHRLAEPFDGPGHPVALPAGVEVDLVAVLGLLDGDAQEQPRCEHAQPASLFGRDALGVVGHGALLVGGKRCPTPVGSR